MTILCVQSVCKTVCWSIVCVSTKAWDNKPGFFISKILIERLKMMNPLRKF